MSATSHDALFPRPGKPVAIGADAQALPDPTEDIADEITSELGDAAAGAPEPARGAAPAPGGLLRERYVLEAPVGSGGTSIVFRATDLRRDATRPDAQSVAVKMLRPERRGEARAIARLQREFRQTQAAAHPNVIRYHDLDCERGSWFIVMELLAGESLAARLRRAGTGGLPAREARGIAAAVADALAHAHARQVVHGDVKPANVFVTGDGAIRLLDFGVAPEPGDSPQPPAGTRAYASPEVIGGSEPVAADDVFSLACMTCELLAGRHPYGRRNADAALRADAAPERPVNVDEALWQVLRRALDPSRVERPGMESLAAALRGGEAAVATGPAAAAAVTPAIDTVALARRPRLLAAGAVAAGLILLLGILIGRLDRDAQPAAASDVPAGSAAAGADTAAPSPAKEIAPEGTMTAPADAPADGPPAAAAAKPPATTGLVTFDKPAMAVSSRAVVAAIPLRHLSRTPRDVKVNWRILEGSARPGRDYGGPEAGVESFVSGNSFRILYVPLVASPEATTDRTFVVELTGATQGVEIGGSPRVTVTILGDG